MIICSDVARAGLGANASEKLLPPNEVKPIMDVGLVLLTQAEFVGYPVFLSLAARQPFELWPSQIKKINPSYVTDYMYIYIHILLIL